MHKKKNSQLGWPSSGFYKQIYMHSTRRCIEPAPGPTSYTNGGQGALHSHSEKCLWLVYFLIRRCSWLFISSPVLRLLVGGGFEAIGQCRFLWKECNYEWCHKISGKDDTPILDMHSTCTSQQLATIHVRQPLKVGSGTCIVLVAATSCRMHNGPSTLFIHLFLY